MDSRQSLPKNTVLDGSYCIERVIGSGGFGVTYEAADVNLKTQVALKEYYPVEFGERDRTMSVRARSERHKKTFEWGRSSFLQEAQMLARFRHPSIVRVARVFEANSTAYMVMDFEQGQSFEAWLTGLGRPPTQSELDRIVAPLLDALELMHGANFLHRDIAPDNIIIRADGTPVLLDFGAARRAVAQMSRALTGIVKAGYSPHEQYATDSRLQGPWSDLYALGGTLYRAVAGKPPEEATLRIDVDHLAPAAKVAKGNYRPGFLAAIDACLKVKHQERPRSVAQLRPMLLGDGSSPPRNDDRRRPDVSPTEVFTPPTPTPPPSKSRLGAPRLLGIAAAVVALLGGAYMGLEFSRRSSTDRAAVEAEKKRVDAEAKRKADAEAAQRQALLDAAARRMEEEQRREAAAEEARRKSDADARRRAEAEARRQAEADAKRKEQGGSSAADAEICRVQSGNVAIAACNRVINSSSSTRQQVIDSYINRGQEYYTARDYDRALSDFTTAISMGPREPIAYGNRGNCWYVKKEYDRAIADYTQAISLERDYTAAYSGRGMAREAKGDIVGARADYRAALSVPQKFQDGKWAHEKARERLRELGN